MYILELQYNLEIRNYTLFYKKLNYIQPSKLFQKLTIGGLKVSEEFLNSMCQNWLPGCCLCCFREVLNRELTENYWYPSGILENISRFSIVCGEIMSFPS